MQRLAAGESDGDMRILVFMPRDRAMRPRSIFASMASRYRESTTIVCCQSETLFPDLSIVT